MKRRLIHHLYIPLLLSLLLLPLSACSLLYDVEEEDRPAADREVVFLIHGLGRTELSMASLEWSLKEHGYEVHPWGYSSTCCALPELGERLADELETVEATNPDKIHFVAHSMGNIITRWVLANDPPDTPGRIVMLAPPNAGSEVADITAPLIDWALPPIDDLKTEGSVAATLPHIQHREVGVIAGRFDGKVSIEETRNIGETDHRVVDAAHTFIMNRPDVHELTVEFLRHGAFPDEADEEPEASDDPQTPDDPQPSTTSPISNPNPRPPLNPRPPQSKNQN